MWIQAACYPNVFKLSQMASYVLSDNAVMNQGLSRFVID